MHRNELAKGFKGALPVVLGYVPIGLAFGVLAAQADLTTLEVFVMSLFVYAGSAQFIAVAMLTTGYTSGAIILTTLLVNSRHLLMSAALAPRFKDMPSWMIPWVSFGVTDETFAVAVSHEPQNQLTPSYMVGLNFISHFFWIASTVFGALAGRLIPNPEAFGLHYALPAMFIGLLVLQLHNALSCLIVCLAAALSLIFKATLPGNWYVILATLIAATLGVIFEQWIKESSCSS